MLIIILLRPVGSSGMIFLRREGGRRAARVKLFSPGSPQQPFPPAASVGIEDAVASGGRVGGTLELNPPPPTAAAAALMGDVQVDVVPENCRFIRCELLLNSGHNFI